MPRKISFRHAGHFLLSGAGPPPEVVLAYLIFSDRAPKNLNLHGKKSGGPCKKKRPACPFLGIPNPKPRSCKLGFSFLFLGICYVYLLYLAEKSVRAVNVVSFAKISAVDLVGFEGIPLTNSRKKTGPNTEP